MSDILTAPMMRTLTEGFVVKRPEGEAAPPVTGKLGSVSIGADHMPSVGAVVHIALHHPDGSTLLVTMGHAGFRSFAIEMNAAATIAMSGRHDAPETKQ